MAEQPNDLEVMVPYTIILEVAGEEVEIKKVKVKQLGQAMAIVHPFYEELKKVAKDSNGNLSDIELAGLAIAHADEVINLIGLLSNKEKEWVEELDVDELVRLFGAILEINLDFFIQKVLPSLSRLVDQFAGPIKKALIHGQMPSKPSLGPTTGT